MPIITLDKSDNVLIGFMSLQGCNTSYFPSPPHQTDRSSALEAVPKDVTLSDHEAHRSHISYPVRRPERM
jgi:hypothetical protein